MVLEPIHWVQDKRQQTDNTGISSLLVAERPVADASLATLEYAWRAVGPSIPHRARTALPRGLEGSPAIRTAGGAVCQFCSQAFCRIGAALEMHLRQFLNSAERVWM